MFHLCSFSPKQAGVGIIKGLEAWVTQDCWISGSIALIQVDQDEATDMAADAAPKAEEQAEGRGQLCHSKLSELVR